MSQLGLLAVLTALFLSLSLSGATLAGGAWLVARRLGLSSSWLERSVPLVMVLPVLVSAVATVAVVLPFEAGCHCLLDASPGLHLCLAHPARSLALLPMALPFLLLLAWRGVRYLPALTRRWRLCRVLRGEAGLLQLVDAPLGNALALPTLSPRVVADRAWWNELSRRERRIVMAHEGAHLRRGDPLVHELLQGLALCWPRALSRGLLKAWRNHAERQADAAAAQSMGRPSEVASLLVRLHAGAHRPASVGLAMVEGPGLSSRVRGLLDAEVQPRLRPDFGPGGLALCLATVLLLLGTAPRLHHVAEALFATLLH